jgi:hypothetical protein
MEPAVSNTLNGRSLHFIHGSLINSDALYLFLVSGSINFKTTPLASLDIVSGNLSYAL